MSETAARTAGAVIPAGYGVFGCRICARLARGGYEDAGQYWCISAGTVVWFPGRAPGVIIAVPAAHFPAVGRAVMNVRLAGFVSDLADAQGIVRYSLLITERDGHPCAQAVPRKG